MIYELLTFICAISSVVISLVKCSKTNELSSVGKTVSDITKLKKDDLSIKEVNGKKRTSIKEVKPEKENNNIQINKNYKTIDNFKRPENQDKFAQRKDPNYMTLNGILDDCFEKTGEKLSESPKKDKTNCQPVSKDTPTLVSNTAVTMPQKPKVCGIAGSSDPQYQTLNMVGDNCFEKT